MRRGIQLRDQLSYESENKTRLWDLRGSRNVWGSLSRSIFTTLDSYSNELIKEVTAVNENPRIQEHKLFHWCIFCNTPRDYRLKYQRSCRPPPFSTILGGVSFSKNNSRKLFYDHNSFFTSNYTNEDMSESKNYRYSTKRKFFKSIWKKSCDHFFNFFGRNPPLPPKIHINAFLQGFQTVL